MYSATNSTLLHQHTFRCRRPGPAPVYLTSQPTVTGPVNTVRIIFHGCDLRTAQLNDNCRPHPTTVAAAPYHPHTRPPDVCARTYGHCCTSKTGPREARSQRLSVAERSATEFIEILYTSTTPMHSSHSSTPHNSIHTRSQDVPARLVYQRLLVNT